MFGGGLLQRRLLRIPMGGSFSTLSAGLHNAWGVYQGRHLFCRLGKLDISDEGFVSWTNEHSTVSFWQFHDNILLMESTYPDSPSDDNRHHSLPQGNSGGILALRAHCALLLDYVPAEEPPGKPLGNTLRIR